MVRVAGLIYSEGPAAGPKMHLTVCGWLVTNPLGP